jgi:hypothetical protein
MRRFSTILFLVACLNGCAFTIHDAMLGGSAGIGKVESGRYYVGSHGRYTEVSRSAFQFSKWHEWSAAGLMLVALVVLADDVLSRRRRRRNA